ncbi:MAG TPA: PAS domain S-box protein, partial [Burkholderiaceae bacterium]|nr:PAS domain S-box protein [Burkholderiaceae bacterium]
PTAAASIELPGTTMLLRAESLLGEPKLVPNLLTGMLALVSIALGIAGFLLWTDVTRRTRAERALREEHAFRKAMEDSLVTGLLARDLHGRITYVNPAFCEMTGYASSELIGRGSPMPYVAPEVQEESDQRHAMMVAGAVNRQGYETVFMRKDGSRLPVLIHEAPLIDATGRHTGWMSSVLDLSDQKRIEELNRRQQEKLQSHSRLSMLGEVASALSHELNQPLAAITSYATACENLLASPPATLDRLRGALARIRSQTDRAAQVIQSVQDFVRSRALERQSIEVEQLVRGIEPLIQLQAKRIGARFTWRIEPGTRIDGDRILLEQVVLNLTRNGIESMASIEPQQRWLEIRASRIAGDERGARVEISICDRGVGVPPEVVPRLFTPFFTTKNDGMGLGLNLCRSVIEQHSGHLGYRPRPGGGSIFYFALPCR